MASCRRSSSVAAGLTSVRLPGISGASRRPRRTWQRCVGRAPEISRSRTRRRSTLLPTIRRGSNGCAWLQMAERLVLDDSGLPPHVGATVVTVGTFDGVHRGHRDVVERLVRRAKELGVPSVLVTFDPHPLEIVNPAAAPLLLTLHDEK